MTPSDGIEPDETEETSSKLGHGDDLERAQAAWSGSINSDFFE